MKHSREDIVHGAKGVELRGTGILIIGDDRIAANLRMMFAKAGYSRMTWVLDDVTVTARHIEQDPMLKLSDMGANHPKALEERFSALTTSNEPELRILCYSRAKETDLTSHRLVLTSGKGFMPEGIRLAEDAQCIWAHTHCNGFLVRLMSNGCERERLRREYPSVPAFDDPILSKLAASHMMAICQDLQHGKTDMKPDSTTFGFTGLHLFDRLGETEDRCRTDAVETTAKRDVSARKIAVVGCGALGSHVASLLARKGFEQVTLIDFDDTREHNLSRLALIENSDAGRYKCEALAHRISERHGFEYDCMVTETEVIPERVLVDMDLIMCCVDRHTARRYLAGISRIRDTPLVQGGFGGDMFQITTGSEIDPIFNHADSQRNSCTGLAIDKDGAEPVGATQAIVGLTASVMVEAAVRLLSGDEDIHNEFHTWRFPDIHSALDLPKRSGTIESRIARIGIPRDCSLAVLIRSIQEAFPESLLKLEHPFVCDWDCPVCGETIHVQKHLHLLSDKDRFHPDCLRTNEHMWHMNLPRRWTLLEDRIGLDSDEGILSRKVTESGMKDGSILPVYLDGEHNGYVEIILRDTICKLNINESVVNAMRDHSIAVHKRTGHEAAGILFGTVDADGTVYICETLSAEVSDSSPTYVEMSSEWLARVLYENEGRKTFCGWWHSHPGFGLTPSERDIRTFGFFPLDTHYSLIIDHTREKNAIAAYQYRGEKVVSCDYKVGKFIK